MVMMTAVLGTEKQTCLWSTFMLTLKILHTALL